MKIVLIDTSIPLNTRNGKYIESIKQFLPDAELKVITWKRDNHSMIIPAFYEVYCQHAEYGNWWKKFLKLFGYAKFVKEKLNSYLPDVIIASHWESLLITPRHLPNKPIVIYENLDVPTGNIVLRKVVRFFELRRLKTVDLIVHASRFFQELYPIPIPQVVLENKSKFRFNEVKHELHNPFVISYIGTVRHHKILDNLLSVSSKYSNLNIKIYGAGHALPYLKRKYSDISNIFFYGEYSFSEIPELYAESDVVWAAYPNDNYNVIYAISNKFHESIMCGKPCIYASRTKLGEYVKEKDIGFIVNPYSREDINNLIAQLVCHNIDLNKYRDNIAKVRKTERTWDEDFSQIVDFIIKKK